jgi:hypothetical protein
MIKNIDYLSGACLQDMTIWAAYALSIKMTIDSGWQQPHKECRTRQTQMLFPGKLVQILINWGKN